MIKFKKLLILFAATACIFSCSPDNSNKTDNGKAANLKVTGSSGSDLLSDMKYTSMNIEIVYENGFRPEDAAINIFRNFLESRVYKPDGIQISLRSVEPSGLSPFDEDDLKTIEKETRTLYNMGDEIAVWIYFANAEKENDSGSQVTLGTAFRNTSIMIYEKTIKDFSERAGAPNRSSIEAATLNHEFGHLFGLVDLGTAPVSDHEDPENDGHCNVEGCLMRSSIEFGSGVINVIDGGEVPGLDDACIQDLQSAGGK